MPQKGLFNEKMKAVASLEDRVQIYAVDSE